MTKTKNQLSVLIADDSDLVRDLIRAVLDQCDAIRIVGEAVDVPQAIETVKALQPDLIILDIVMPGGSGFDVLRHAKRLPVPPVVVLFSNFFLPYMKAEYGRGGADFLFDKGTEFETLCKTVIEAAHAFQKRHTDPKVLDLAPGIKILLVEDNATDSKLFTEVLRNGGCEVIQTNCAEDALLFLQCGTVDLILTDVVLPGMDGLSLVNEFKATDSTQRIPIIDMSAVSEWPFARIARNYGCFTFLQKPVDTRHLAELINRAVTENQN